MIAGTGMLVLSGRSFAEESSGWQDLYSHILMSYEQLKELQLEQEREEPEAVSYKDATDQAFRESAEYLSGDFSYDGRWQKILCIGDSITQGVQSGTQEPWENPWPLVMSTFLDVDVENAGMGGSTIWSGGTYPMCSRIAECGEADAVFVMGGINDWMYGENCPIGSREEPRTFVYDTDQMFQYIKNNYQNADVFIVLPLDTDRLPDTENYTSIEVFRSVEAKLAEKYDFYVIDLPAQGIMSAADQETREAYFSDDIHPNTAGYQVLGTIITARALQLTQ